MIKVHLYGDVIETRDSFSNCTYQCLLIDEAHMDRNSKKPDKGKPNLTFPNIKEPQRSEVNKEGKAVMDIAIDKSVCQMRANGYRKAPEAAFYGMCHCQVAFTSSVELL